MKSETPRFPRVVIVEINSPGHGGLRGEELGEISRQAGDDNEGVRAAMTSHYQSSLCITWLISELPFDHPNFTFAFWSCLIHLKVYLLIIFRICLLRQSRENAVAQTHKL